MKNNLLHLDCVIGEMGVKSHDCHPQLPRGIEYRQLGLGAGSISLEEAMFLAGLVYIVRPDIVIELGTESGASALILSAACKDLGKGKVHTLDMSRVIPYAANVIKEKYDLPLNFITDIKSIDYLENAKRVTFNQSLKYLIFSDTDIKVRPKEVELITEIFPSGTFVAVHDTSDLHPYGPMNLKDSLMLNTQYVELDSPRGMTLLKVVKP